MRPRRPPLGANVRERQGLAYYSYSDLEGGLGPGAWAARAGINPANVERAVEAIRTEIRGMQDAPVTDDLPIPSPAMGQAPGAVRRRGPIRILRA